MEDKVYRSIMDHIKREIELAETRRIRADSNLFKKMKWIGICGFACYLAMWIWVWIVQTDTSHIGTWVDKTDTRLSSYAKNEDVEAILSKFDLKLVQGNEIKPHKVALNKDEYVKWWKQNDGRYIIFSH